MDFALSWGGMLLECVLLWRLIAWRAWRRYPWFFGFFLYGFVRLLLINYVNATDGISLDAYRFWYWTTSLLAVVLWFPVVWEVFRNVFPRRSLLSDLAGIVLSTFLLGLAAYYVFASEFPSQLVVPDAQRKAGLAIAGAVVCALILARYYGVTLSRNVWGIAMGLGLFAATTVLSFSALDLNLDLFPVFRYVRPVSFILTLIIWTWALWSYTPPLRPEPLKSTDESLLLHSQSPWVRIWEAIRRALGL